MKRFTCFNLPRRHTDVLFDMRWRLIHALILRPEVPCLAPHLLPDYEVLHDIARISLQRWRWLTLAFLAQPYATSMVRLSHTEAPPSPSGFHRLEDYHDGCIAEVMMICRFGRGESHYDAIQPRTTLRKDTQPPPAPGCRAALAAL